MAQSPITSESVVRHAKRVVAGARACTLWFAGLPVEALKSHRADVQMRHTAVGWVIMLWYAFMLITWAKSGGHYYGTAGGFAFCLPPSIMLALDRLIVGQIRNPAGELQAYAIAGLRPIRWEYALRVFAALTFSAVTTQVFLVTNSMADIRELQHREQMQANAGLRADLTGRIEAGVAERMRTITTKSSELEAQSLLLRDDLAKARQVAEDAESKARGAQFNVAAELGGIEGRDRGQGARHDAYALIARQSQDVAVNARAREMRSREMLAKTQVELGQLAAERERSTAARAEGLSNLDAAMQEDARFVRRKQGLFADASALLRLYADPQVGPGLAVMTVLAALFLTVLEMSPLLAFAMHGTTPVDVERIALNRADAARIVAAHEIELVRAASGRAVRVRPVTPADIPPEPDAARAPTEVASGEQQ